jgi:hypothetical protein
MAMGIDYTEYHPDRLADVFATKLDIGPELRVIGNTIWTPSRYHTASFVLYEVAIVIAAIIDIGGIQFCGTIIVECDYSICIADSYGRNVVVITIYFTSQGACSQ